MRPFLGADNHYQGSLEQHALLLVMFSRTQSQSAAETEQVPLALVALSPPSEDNPVFTPSGQPPPPLPTEARQGLAGGTFKKTPTYVYHHYDASKKRKRRRNANTSHCSTTCATRPKKRRQKATSKQAAVLEAFFSANRFPSRQEVERLSTQIDMSFARIKNWFRNKRARTKAATASGSTSHIFQDCQQQPVLAPLRIGQTDSRQLPSLAHITSIVSTVALPRYQPRQLLQFSAGM